ncbi:MAG: hypothetical protein GC155_15995 [Alphaproteobacteria bacterium]|nr:hypothetical protein [Alphaproteobacteria bacterium]
MSSQPSQQIDTGNYSNCVTRILPGEPGAGVYGMLKNNCPFPVDVRYCNDGADPNSFAATMSCTGSRNWGGSGSIGASDKSSALVGGRTYWYACKKPAGVTDSTYNPGQGIAARCK